MSKLLKDKLRELLSHKQSRHYYASKLGVPERVIEQMIAQIREEDRGGLIETDDRGVKMISEKSNEEGYREVQYLSTKPLNRKEIEEL